MTIKTPNYLKYNKISGYSKKSNSMITILNYSLKNIHSSFSININLLSNSLIEKFKIYYSMFNTFLLSWNNKLLKYPKFISNHMIKYLLTIIYLNLKIICFRLIEMLLFKLLPLSKDIRCF